MDRASGAKEEGKRLREALENARDRVYDMNPECESGQHALIGMIDDTLETIGEALASSEEEA